MAVTDDLTKTLNGLVHFKANLKRGLMDVLKALGSNPSGFGEAINSFIRKSETELETMIVPLRTVIAQISQTPVGTAGATTSNSQMETFIKFANFLDEQGAYALADQVTDLARMFGYAAPFVNKEPQQPAIEGSLSTRYCPDHVGVPVIRLTDNSVQCVLDGKIYDYSSGYVNYKGQYVPGSSISEQTPSQSDCGGIPMRTYEPSANILNRDS